MLRDIQKCSEAIRNAAELNFELGDFFIKSIYIDSMKRKSYVRRYSVLSMHGIQAIREVSVPEKAKQLNKIAISMAKVEKYALKKAEPLPVKQKAVPVVITDLVPEVSSEVSDEFSDLTEDLVEVQDGETLVNSRQVAYRFDKRHDNVMRDIDEIIGSSKLSSEFFHESIFDNRGKSYKMYLMTRDGFSLLAMGFTGKKALDWKIRFLQAFKSMENQLVEKDRTPRTYVEALRSLLETAKGVSTILGNPHILIKV